jgi:cell wall-associated NlpC family hydrolase
MTMTEQEQMESAQRARVVEVARSWTGTPFVWGCAVKGKEGGVDCGRFLGAVMNEAGVQSIDLASVKQPPPQWFMHKGSGSYLDLIRAYATEYELKPGQVPQPGDIVVAKFGLDWAHAALVVAWPRVIAAVFGSVVSEWPSIYRSPQFQNHELKYFDPFAPAAGSGEAALPVSGERA